MMTLESAVAVFFTRLALNIGLVLAANWLIGPADLNLSGSIFFIAMLSLITSLHDRWLPVRATRDAVGAARVEG
jgi:hypothetical protein